MRLRLRLNSTFLKAVGFILAVALVYNVMNASSKSDKIESVTILKQIQGVFTSLRNGQLTYQERSVALQSMKKLLDTQLYLQEQRGNDSIAELQRIKRNLGGFVYQLMQSMNATSSDMPKRNQSTDLLPITMFNYMPHLLVNMEALNASMKLSRGRKDATLVMGIPTINRGQSGYLQQTLNSIITSLTSDQQEKCIIVVFIAEGYTNNSTFINKTISMIKSDFSQYLESGLLEALVPSQYYYPNMEHMKLSFGDTQDRVKWRAKQNLDYSYLMLYCQSRGRMYMQLEDDIITTPGFYEKIITKVDNVKNTDWILLEFSTLGFIGKLFKTEDLPWIADFFLSFYKDKPIDWLLDNIFYVKYCTPEKSLKVCNAFVASKYRLSHKPSLFQHIGLHSSLKGKIQKLKDKTFLQSKTKNYINPPAICTTSIVVYKQFSLSSMYQGNIYFWGIEPAKNDYIDIKFTPAIFIDKFVIFTGLPDHKDDILNNTLVLVKPAKPVDGQQVVINRNHTLQGYVQVGAFNEIGVAQGNIGSVMGLIDSMRLVVLENSKSWLIINEFRIIPVKTK